jgi:hypothetical protein
LLPCGGFASGDAVRLVGADIVCSLVYGMQTVLFILVARSSGLGLPGYGAILVQIMTETGLQRALPHDVFGRA